MTVLAALPSPEQGVWYLGPIPLRGYALAIVLGVVIAIWLGNRRWIARGGTPGLVGDIAVWAVPMGLVGARLYHVVTDWEPYFGPGGDPLLALQIWRGGLGIWGAIAFGALGAWIACRRAGVPLPAVADAVAPGIVLAQALGRWGNWFNQELYGRPTDLPWGLQIDPENRYPGYETIQAYHPTFLYESLWCVGVAVLVIGADRIFRLGHGRAFALYVAAYTAGRAWIEELRIDPANEVLGMRLNFWTSVVILGAAIAYIVVSARLRPGREDPAKLGGVRGRPVADGPAADSPAADSPAADGSAADDDSVGVRPVTDEADGDAGSATRAATERGREDQDEAVNGDESPRS